MENREIEQAKAGDARKLLALLGYTLEYTWTHSYGDFLIEYWENSRLQVLELHAPSHNAQFNVTTSLEPSSTIGRGSFKLAKKLEKNGRALEIKVSPCYTAETGLYEMDGRYHVVSSIVGHGSRAHTIVGNFNDEMALQYFHQQYSD